jgi:hypothetical protein
VKPQTKKALRVHVGLALAETICISAFVVEISRAMAGNTLSWAYVFEWPILGIYAVFMWRRLLREDDATTSTTVPSPKDESRLDAYNEYLNQVHGSRSAKHTSDGD